MLTNKVEQIILGSMFGDAFLKKYKSSNVAFIETHSIKQKDYLLWKKELLEESFNEWGTIMLWEKIK